MHLNYVLIGAHLNHYNPTLKVIVQVRLYFVLLYCITYIRPN